MSLSDIAAWEKSREFIKGHIDASRKRETPEAFNALGLDPHLQNCIGWLYRLVENPSPAVLISTFGHDVDRALVDRVRREDYPNYELYKAVHAAHSAKVLCDFLRRTDASPSLVKGVEYLVRNHDTVGEWAGKTAEQTLGLVQLKSSDGLSFFDVNFETYMLEQKGNITAIKGKMTFMYEKMCGRSFDQMTAGVPRKLNDEVQLEVQSQIEDIQRHAEEMVKPLYLGSLDKLRGEIKKYDSRRDTKVIDIKDITSS